MTAGREYINTGAAFRAADGSRIGKGQRFVPTPEELARRRYKLRPVDGGQVEPTARAAEGEPITDPNAPPAQRFEGFERTRFASPRAHEVALELGLSDMTFEGAVGSSDGAFTADDVRELVGEPATLDSVPFASPQARAAAEEAKLGPDAFYRKRRASEQGFTVDDVARIAAGVEDTAEEPEAGKE